MSDSYEYLFGPVPSRRLGRSLGVDLIPFKTCTMNCVYCQLGETNCETGERGDYVPMQHVLAELDQWLARGGMADHVTLAGSGEPTLHTRFGDVFRWVRDKTDMASVLLTNGSLLYLPEVRAGAALADKVKVTMSAWDEASFRAIHRPAQGITFDLLVKGERAFREEYAGEFSVEVFIVDGINSQVSHVRQMAQIVESMNPDRIDINTAVRPPAVKGVVAPAERHLQMLAEFFGPKAEVVAFSKPPGSYSLDVSEEALLGLVKRHPATCAQLAGEFGLPEERTHKLLRQMEEDGLLQSESRDGTICYFHRQMGQ
jgi:wyosine [tRNA(Phe)-imidazoG37] synthetase (radical SAM superfamily)